MIISEILPFIELYIEEINQTIKAHSSSNKLLTKKQQYWLGFCILGVLLTQSINWAAYERASLGKYAVSALSWMFKHSKLPWDNLLSWSTAIIIKRYNITQGILIVDSTDKKRSKTSHKIAYLHKRFDKATGGFFNGQCLEFLVLVSDIITLPVGFKFYQPDPVMTAWVKEDKRLKNKGVSKKNRPKKPPISPNYPTSQSIAIVLLKEFKLLHTTINVQAILSDAFYGTGEFMDTVATQSDGKQVISQIRNNQNILYRNKKMHVKDYFDRINKGIEKTITVRGNSPQKVTISSARLYVCAHKKKRFVIALKYEGEKDYRYIVATNLSWRTMDIVQAFTLRWLIEVFFQDWKSNEGWGNLTKHPGVEGSSRSLILSLLADHSLFFHPDQTARLNHKLPAYTVGSLREQIEKECLVNQLKQAASSESPVDSLEKLMTDLKKSVVLRESTKHMSGRDLGRLEPTPSLVYHVTD